MFIIYVNIFSVLTYYILKTLGGVCMNYREVLNATRRKGQSVSRSAYNSNSSPLADKQDECPQLPGTVLRIFIPGGTEINLLNLIELSSPGGICIIVRLPFLGKSKPKSFSAGDLAGILDTIRQAGGSIEVVNQ